MKISPLLLALTSASSFAGTSSPENIAIQPTETSAGWWLTITP